MPQFSTEKSLSRYILVVLSISVVFTALVLVILNAWVQNKTLGEMASGIPFVDTESDGTTYEDGYREGYTAARETYKRLCPIANEETRFITGPIQLVGEDTIIMNAENLDADELVDGIGTARTVKVDDSTKIIRLEQKSVEEQQAEMQKWQESGMSRGDPPPSPSKEVEMVLKNLEPNQRISVMAAEDVRLLDNFTAIKIVVSR